jgi:hypothetical protein
MIHIFTSVVNRPEFVELQDRLFKKFLKDEYRFHVVDDSVDDSLTEEFKSVCESNGISYYRKPDRVLGVNPAQACAIIIQWTYDNLIRKKHFDDIVFFCDSDLFLVDEFSIEQYMEDGIIGGLPQQRGDVIYMWNGIMFLNMSKMKEIDLDLDFSEGIVEGELTDVGGHTFYYFKRNNLTLKESDVQYPTHFNDIEIQNESVTRGYNFELHLNGKFLHYRAATNWHSNWKGSEDPLEKKTRIFNQIITSILNE